MIKKLKRVSFAWWFLIVVVLAYIVLYFIKSETFFSSLNFFVNILNKVIPIFILVFVLMSLTNYFITKEIISKYLRQKGIKKNILLEHNCVKRFRYKGRNQAY